MNEKMFKKSYLKLEHRLELTENLVKVLLKSQDRLYKEHTKLQIQLIRHQKIDLENKKVFERRLDEDNNNIR